MQFSQTNFKRYASLAMTYTQTTFFADDNRFLPNETFGDISMSFLTTTKKLSAIPDPHD